MSRIDNHGIIYVMDNKLIEQSKNSKEEHPSVEKPWLFKPGQSGNLNGRPKGSKSMKSFVKEYLEGLDDEAKIEYLDGLPKELLWKMAEGNPENKTDLTTKGKAIIPSIEVQDQIDQAMAQLENDNKD